MAIFDIDFGFFSYLIDWLGFSAGEQTAVPMVNTTTIRPIGG